MAPDEAAGHGEQLARLLRRQLLVETRAAADGLEAQQLELVEAQLADQPRDVGHVVERAAADDAVDADLRFHCA